MDKEFVKKLFAALAIEVGDEEVDDEKAIALIVAKATTPPEPPKRPKALVPPSILELLELPDDASESDARGKIMALKFPADSVPRDRYEGLESQMRERDINDLIERACRAGDGEMEGKLYPHEREWAMAEARKDFDALRAFIRHRPKVLSIMAKLPSGKKDPARIEPVEEQIMKQMGVSRDTYLKYNTAH